MQKISTIVRIRNQISPAEPLPFIFTEDEIEAQKNTFSFDRVYGPETQTVDIFSTSIVPVLNQFVSNYSATVFAYGQSGSGKSYSMVEETGIVFQSVEFILQYFKQLQVQCVEIYNECIRDLSEPSLVDLKLLESKSNSVAIENSPKNPFSSLQEFRNLFQKWLRNRTNGVTDLNLHSSRSHLLLIFSPMNINSTAQLTLVDLAGSERLSKTNAQNQTLQQGNCINQSLLVLGRVISAIIKKEQFIPFRDSKLTRILQNSLGGTSSCLVMVCVSSSSKNVDESVQTLRFGIRCGEIVNNVKRQISIAKEDQNCAALREENEKLRQDLEAKEQENQALSENVLEKEKEINEMREENERITLENDKKQMDLDKKDLEIGQKDKDINESQKENDRLRKQNSDLESKIKSQREGAQKVINDILTKVKAREAEISRAAKNYTLQQRGFQSDIRQIRALMKDMVKNGEASEDTE